MPYLSIKTAARELGVSEVTIRRGIRTKRIPAVRFNGTWRIPGSFFEGLEQEAYSGCTGKMPEPRTRSAEPAKPRARRAVQWLEPDDDLELEDLEIVRPGDR